MITHIHTLHKQLGICILSMGISGCDISSLCFLMLIAAKQLHAAQMPVWCEMRAETRSHGLLGSRRIYTPMYACT